MTTPSPALTRQGPDYPPEWNKRVPKQVVMTKTVRDPRRGQYGSAFRMVALYGTLFDVWVGENGYCLVIFESGQMLDVERTDFEVIQWHQKGEKVNG